MRQIVMATCLTMSLLAGVASAEPAQSGERYDATVTVTDTVINTVKPLIFGDNIEWTNDGMGVWIAKEKKFDEKLVSEFKEVGITHLRYPGGGLSDRFHWDYAVGERKELPNIFAGDAPTYPNFGPDEFMELCRQLGIPSTITLNAGDGTAEQAAGWVKYNVEHNFPVTGYAVGNEIWIAEEKDPARHSPEEYVEIFKRFKSAIDAVAPDVKIGAIGLHDTGGFSMNKHPNWMEVVLKGVGEDIDFFDVHNSYAPAARVMPGGAEVSDDDYAAAFLAAPVYVADNFEVTKQDFEKYVPGGGKHIEIHVTEHGPLLYPIRGQEHFDSDLAWNRGLIAALYQAQIFNVFLREPRIALANHMPLVQGGFGALVAFQGEYPNRRYMRNIVFYIFQMYSRLAGREVLATTVEAPTYDTAGVVALVPKLEKVPMIDAAAYRSADGKALSVILLNRSIAADADILLEGIDGWIAQKQTQLAADSYSVMNSFDEPDKHKPEPVAGTRQMLPVGQPYTVTVPKHSLLRVDLEFDTMPEAQSGLGE